MISGGLTLEAQARIAKNRATALETQARIARNRAAALQRRVASQRQWPDPAAHGTTVRRKRRTTPDHTPADRELAEAAALAEEEEAMAAAAVAASQAHMEAAHTPPRHLVTYGRGCANLCVPSICVYLIYGQQKTIGDRKPLM